jgi:hypothetical protein
MLRIIRAPFYQLCKTLKERHLLEDSIQTFVKVQVEMVLLVGGHNHRFGVIQKTFKQSTETVSRHFKKVLIAIGEIEGDMIWAPTHFLFSW